MLFNFRYITPKFGRAPGCQIEKFMPFGERHALLSKVYNIIKNPGAFAVVTAGAGIIKSAIAGAAGASVAAVAVTLATGVTSAVIADTINQTAPVTGNTPQAAATVIVCSTIQV